MGFSGPQFDRETYSACFNRAMSVAASTSEQSGPVGERVSTLAREIIILMPWVSRGVVYLALWAVIDALTAAILEQAGAVERYEITTHVRVM